MWFDLKLIISEEQAAERWFSLLPSAFCSFEFSERLSLEVLKKIEAGISVDELRRMIEARIDKLKAEAGLQRKRPALEIPYLFVNS